MFIDLFTERERKRERETSMWERNINQLPLLCGPTGGWNPQPSGAWEDIQPTEPPGQSPNIICLRDYFFGPICILNTFVKDQLIIICGFVSRLSIVWSICLSYCQYFNCCSFVMYFEIRKCDACSFVELDHLFSVGRNAKWYSYYGRHMVQPLWYNCYVANNMGVIKKLIIKLWYNPALPLLVFFLIIGEMKKEGERERKRNTDVREKHWLFAFPNALRDLTCNPDMCPDQELNQQPFGLWDNAQSTEPHWLVSTSSIHPKIEIWIVQRC